MSSQTQPPPRGCHGQPAASAHLGATTILLLVGLVSIAHWQPERPRPALSARQAHLLLNPNTATRGELMLLPRIGPALSDRIVAYRESAGVSPAFSSPDDLRAVRGIGGLTVNILRPHLHFGDSPRVTRGTAP